MKPVPEDLGIALKKEGYEAIGIDDAGRVFVKEINQRPSLGVIDVKALHAAIAAEVSAPIFTPRWRKPKREPAWRVRERERRAHRPQEGELRGKETSDRYRGADSPPA